MITKVPIKDIEKEDRLCMKFLTPDAQCAESVFQWKPLFVALLTFQKIYQGQGQHDEN